MDTLVESHDESIKVRERKREEEVEGVKDLAE